VALSILSTGLWAADEDVKAREQFQDILASINQRSFSQVRSALNQNDLTNRIYGVRPLADQVKQTFVANFWEVVESAFMQNLPEAETQLNGELVFFDFQGNSGTAAVRFRLPKYEYLFMVFELRRQGRGRLRIVDWFDTSIGQTFAAEISEDLVTVIPTKAATRRLISIKDPTDLQLFQATEILKATRDNQPKRFFEIYDAFDEQLMREPFFAKFAVYMAHSVKDIDRFVNALDIFVDVYAADPNYSLLASDAYMLLEDYENAYEQLLKFQNNFTVKEGALPAKLSALALAIGKPDQAEEFALQATQNEPSLELGWWSLLRARAAAEDFAGAIEPLTQLEDAFGHYLDEAKLKRDRFRAFGALSVSEEFKEWRESRN
jgi:hypothetical protein